MWGEVGFKYKAGALRINATQRSTCQQARSKVVTHRPQRQVNCSCAKRVKAALAVVIWQSRLPAISLNFPTDLALAHRHLHHQTSSTLNDFITFIIPTQHNINHINSQWLAPSKPPVSTHRLHRRQRYGRNLLPSRHATLTRLTSPCLHSATALYIIILTHPLRQVHWWQGPT